MPKPCQLDKLDAATKDKCLKMLLENRTGAIARVAQIAGVSRQAVWLWKKGKVSKARTLTHALETAANLFPDIVKTVNPVNPAVVGPSTKKRADRASLFNGSKSTERQIEAALPFLTYRQNRISALQDLYDRLRSVIDERSATMAHVPGGKSGLLLEIPGKFGSTFKLDGVLVTEVRELGKQIAIELGEWDSPGGNLPQSVSFNQVIVLPKSGADATTGSGSGKLTIVKSAADSVIDGAPDVEPVIPSGCPSRSELDEATDPKEST